jgi:hypothetical protein
LPVGRPRFVSDKLTTEADARELWLLSHKYEVDGVKEWLLKHGITVDSVCAAASFACDCVADVCDGLLEACRKHASWSLPKVRESALCGVRVDVALELLRAHAENAHLGRACDVAEGFRYAQRWACANEGLAVENKTVHKEAERLSGMLELSLLPASFLSEHVRTSGIVSADKLCQMQEEMVKAQTEAQQLANRPVQLRQVAKLSDALEDGTSFKKICNIAIGGRDSKQRVAVVDDSSCCVYVFSLEDMKLLWVVGGQGQGPGQFIDPGRAAFDGRGHLYVSDWEFFRVQVFDCEGKYVRCLGQQDSGPGELSFPSSMSLSGQGDILVWYWGNQHVHVFDGDGRFVRVVPSRGDPEHLWLKWPRHVSSTADGNMIVADDDCVRVFSRDGLFVKEIKPPHVQGENWTVDKICTGPRGELVAFERGARTVRVLDTDGARLWTSDFDDGWRPDCMAMDWRGQLLCVSAEMDDVYVFKPEPSEES